MLLLCSTAHCTYVERISDSQFESQMLKACAGILFAR
jgi:hypothetical protein